MADDNLPVPTTTGLDRRAQQVQRRRFRSESLDQLRAAALGLDDQVDALVLAEDLDGLAEGGQDLQAFIGDLQAVMTKVRVELGKLVDAEHDEGLQRRHAEKVAEWEAKVAAAQEAGRKPPKPPKDLDLKATGPKRAEVGGVGVIECNGGWTRKGWESSKLLRELVLATVRRAWQAHGERIVTAEGEVVPLEESATLADLVAAIEECLPINASTSWRTGQRKANGEVTGLMAHGFDDADYCTREDKVRMASIPRIKGTT